MPSEEVNAVTRREWRELGFHYDRDDESKVWKLTGSASGLLRFRDILLDYVGNPAYDAKSEHQHYGPYSYLEIMTWPEAGFDDHAIYGSFADLARLASLIGAKIASATPGSEIRIREEYSPSSPYSLTLACREDGFDPASADPFCWPNAPSAASSPPSPQP